MSATIGFRSPTILLMTKQADTDTASSDLRSGLASLWRWTPVGLAAAIFGLGSWVIVYFINRSGDASKPFTQLEQTFFGVFTLAAGTGLSWMIASFYARGQASSQYAQLARPALRRVQGAKESAALVLAAIDRRAVDAEEGERASLKSLGELVTMHARVLDDAVADWQEILPIEVAAILTEGRENRDRLNALHLQQDADRVQLSSRFEELTEAVKTVGEKATVAPADLAPLRRELAAVQEQLKAQSLPARVGAVFVNPRPGSVLVTGTADLNPRPDPRSVLGYAAIKDLD